MRTTEYTLGWAAVDGGPRMMSDPSPGLGLFVLVVLGEVFMIFNGFIQFFG